MLSMEAKLGDVAMEMGGCGARIEKEKIGTQSDYVRRGVLNPCKAMNEIITSPSSSLDMDAIVVVSHSPKFHLLDPFHPH